MTFKDIILKNTEQKFRVLKFQMEMVDETSGIRKFGIITGSDYNTLMSKNGNLVDKKETDISYDGEKGHYKINDNGNVKESEVQADSYAEFLKKIYEPLMNKDDSISDFTIGSEDAEENDEDAELIINISHDK